MSGNGDFSDTRRRFAFGACATFILVLSTELPSLASEDAGSVDQFDYLSKHDRCDCSADFAASIPGLPATSRLQGSCCHPMDRKRYGQQTEGLRKFSAIPEIPPDPYDVAVSLVQKLIVYYDLTLNSAEQQAYDYAAQHSDEKGPCCCQCWRWKAYGGLAKFLIRARHLSGMQVTEIWNLSDACGGGAGHG